MCLGLSDGARLNYPLALPLVYVDAAGFIHVWIYSIFSRFLALMETSCFQKMTLELNIVFVFMDYDGLNLWILFMIIAIQVGVWKVATSRARVINNATY